MSQDKSGWKRQPVLPCLLSQYSHSLHLHPSVQIVDHCYMLLSCNCSLWILKSVAGKLLCLLALPFHDEIQFEIWQVNILKLWLLQALLLHLCLQDYKYELWGETWRLCNACASSERKTRQCLKTGHSPKVFSVKISKYLIVKYKTNNKNCLLKSLHFKL